MDQLLTTAQRQIPAPVGMESALRDVVVNGEMKPFVNGIDNNNINSTINNNEAGASVPVAAAGTTTTTTTTASGINPALSGGNGVRILGLHEYKQAALCLADAFATDEVAWYFLDTPDRADWTREQKWALHVEIFEYIVYAHLLKGLVVCAGPDYDCVALWMPPGKNMDDLLTILRSGMWRLNYRLSREGKKRFFDEFLPLLHDTKLQVMGPRDHDSWYLVYLGTKSTSRGKGYARKVIEHVSNIADAEGRACYLESSNQVNRIIYGKLGYELRKNIYLQRDTEHVELDIMVREPVKKRDSMFDEDESE